MDLNVLKTFVAVCEYSGFSAAGEKLGYTQSTVSSQIRQLEKELKVTLFDRFYHKIVLTSAGTIVLNYARKILTAREMMMTELHQPGEISGELRLSMSNSICTRYFCDDFLNLRTNFPEIRLKITENETAQMFDMLRKNEADLVFTLDSHIYDSEFEICGERPENTHFVAASNHPLASCKTLLLKDILSEAFVMTEQGMSYRRILNEYLASLSMEIHPQLEIANPLQICSIVEKSQMLSFLPDFITEQHVQEGKLVFLPVQDCSVTVWTQILIHKNKWRSPALNALIHYYKSLITE